MACRVAGSATLMLAAHAPRSTVFLDTGSANMPPANDANGVSWYYDTVTSWGFFVPGDGVYRSGETVLNPSSGTYERLLYHAD